MRPPELSIIGAGNVATHLGKGFAEAGCPVRQVYSQTPANAAVLAQKLNAATATSIDAVHESEVVLIAVSDDAIPVVAGQLSLKTSMVVHTSGTVPIDVLANCASHYGVIYPLQTFSNDRIVKLHGVPLLLEANDESGYGLLERLARLISPDIRKVNSADRLKYHLSAVIANNFTNYLLCEAHDYLKEQNLDFAALHPLISETVAKALELGPANAQTGPAKRNDQGTIRKHLELLEGDELKALYEFLTQRINSIS